MTVRVLRLMEYVYPNAEEALIDMEHWGVPPNGAHVFRISARNSEEWKIRSSVIGPLYETPETTIRMDYGMPTEAKEETP